jgi:hypothetical protein
MQKHPRFHEGAFVLTVALYFPLEQGNLLFLECYVCFADDAFESCVGSGAAVVDIVGCVAGWEVHIFLIDVFELHHYAWDEEPSNGSANAANRDIGDVRAHRGKLHLHGVIARADPELIGRTKAVDEFACHLRCITSRRFRKGAAIGIFIRSEEFQPIILDERIDHEG